MRKFFAGLIFLCLGFSGIALADHSSGLVADSWRLPNPANSHQIEGYAGTTSVLPGSSLDLHISCIAGSFTGDIFRAGYYSGAGRRPVMRFGPQQCHKYSVPTPGKETGLVAPNWPTSVLLGVPSTWQPGIYLIELSSGGHQSYIPFTVKSPSVNSDFLFVHAVNTDNAYNIWGGNSLYHGHTDTLGINRAAEVTFERPFDRMPEAVGSGDFFRWEYPMIVFLERYGYRVDYATDVDIDKDPGMLKRYKTVIFTGHDEYWSEAMRTGYLNALRSGTSFAIFGANTAYRPIRYKNDDEIIVDYKKSTIDPLKTSAGDQIPTPQSWRDAPLFKPESELLGLSWEGQIINSSQPAPLVVSDSKSWIFDGTDLKMGEKLPGLVGYEYDRYLASGPSPAPVDLIFHSPVTNNKGDADYSDAGYFRYPNGGQVFVAGTMDWSFGLDPSNKSYSQQLVKITQNILDRFSGRPDINLDRLNVPR